MNDEQIFELAEKCAFQDDFGYWNFKDEGLLDFVFLVQKSLGEPVAWHEPDSYGNVTTYKEWAIEHGWRPLYTAPPKQDEGSNKEKVSQWMMDKGYATGHGDSVVDLLQELEWQVAEREREACAKIVEADGLARGECGYMLTKAATRIRARGEK